MTKNDKTAPEKSSGASLSSQDVELGSSRNSTEVSSKAGEGEQSFKGRHVTKRNAGAKPSVTSRDDSKPKSATAHKAKQSSASETAALIKYGSLFLLVTQMVGLVLLMRYTRTKGAKLTSDGKVELYLASTAVFLMEVTKLAICTAVVFAQAGYSISGLFEEYYHNVWNAPMEVLKLCVPSLLYTIQNNLLYFALSNLDAATYQVCYQLKILTTALFSVVLLQRQFSGTKWFSLILLTVGVAIVEISGSGDSAHSTGETNVTSASAAITQNRFLGLVAVVCAACTSGFSGVYFERILKGAKTSLWLRNIQMGLPSVIIAFIGVYVKDGESVKSKGFFVGYNSMVWTVIMVQAAGGLIVALVVKYADNVLKVFATSFSIILSCLVSAILFDFRPNIRFSSGATLVMISTVLYSQPTALSRLRFGNTRRRKQTELPMHSSSASVKPKRPAVSSV